MVQEVSLTDHKQRYDTRKGLLFLREPLLLGRVVCRFFDEMLFNGVFLLDWRKVNLRLLSPELIEECYMRTIIAGELIDV